MERTMQNAALLDLKSKLADISRTRTVGRVVSADGNTLRVSGLEDEVKLGDRLRLLRGDGSFLMGDVLCLGADGAIMLPDDPPARVALGDRVVAQGPVRIAPDQSWVGQVIDSYGHALNGRLLKKGGAEFDIQNEPPAAVARKGLGQRLDTGFHLFNTILPIVRGQRVGIFAGSGVGKSRLLADLVKAMDADFVVVALVGERGREINDFTQNTLGEVGLSRTVVVASSADTAATARMRCPMTAMRVAEYFRDQGQHVLLFVDSITRFAEAQREVAVSAGEFPSLRGFPPSLPSAITKLAERAGPGPRGSGDITAVFSVLVAASDMDEPVADMLRGVLDGHVVLDRQLADQGQFPAVDILKSVSRALPDAATQIENSMLAKARSLVSKYHESSALVRSGLYSEGSDVALDQAIAFHHLFEDFRAGQTRDGIGASFERLRLTLRRSGALKD
jgi:flagellum-specific ATP synthase